MFALSSLFLLLLLSRGAWSLVRLVRAVPRRNEDFEIG
jgi:hypothetical protein